MFFFNQKKIYQIWKEKKVLFLVIFDLKKAFNNVTINIFLKYIYIYKILENYI